MPTMTATTAIWSPVSTAVSMSGGGISPGLYQQAGARQYRCPQRPVQASSGGGSILGPLLVGTCLPVAAVAPAALAFHLYNPVVDPITYGLLARRRRRDRAELSWAWPAGRAG